MLHLYYYFSGFFWHIDSLHYDANFTLNGDRNNCKYKIPEHIIKVYIVNTFITCYVNTFWHNLKHTGKYIFYFEGCNSLTHHIGKMQCQEECIT